MRITLILHNIRSTYNVGSILRSAEGFGVKQIYYSGYTPVYNDRRLLPHLRTKLNHQIAKTALGAEKLVPQEPAESIEKLLLKLRKEGWLILGLENHIEAKTVPLKEIHTELAHWDTGLAHQRPSSAQTLQTSPSQAQKSPKSTETLKVALLLGEEVHGIPPELFQYVDLFTEIPMFGEKESFNVSIAAAIALYELRRNLPQNLQPML